MNAQDVANYFLFMAGHDEEDLISNLKLQKLLYYAQGFNLALLDTPLFDNQIEKWTHGPVVPDVYHQYKSFGNNPIDCPDEFSNEAFSPETLGLLEEVWSVFGQYTASALRNISHQEIPWKNADERGVISHESMKEFFKSRIENG